MISTLEPGKTWRTEIGLWRFPGYFGNTEYTLMKPGQYRVRVTYACRELDRNISPLAKGSWTGSVA